MMAMTVRTVPFFLFLIKNVGYAVVCAINEIKYYGLELDGDSLK